MSRPSLTAEKDLWGWAVTRKFIKANIEVANINAELEAERDAVIEVVRYVADGKFNQRTAIDMARAALEGVDGE